MSEQQRKVWRLSARRQRERLHAQRVMVDGRWFHQDAPHGNTQGYNRYGCRCERCTAAQRDDIARRRAARYAERIEVDGRLVHPRARHGTPSGRSNYGCQCGPCRAASAAERRHYRAGGAS